MEGIKVLDETVFWWINSHYNTPLDWLMWFVSSGWCWFGVILLFYISVTLTKDRKNWLWVLIGIGLCFLIADQISTNAIKDGVMRLRPCHALEGVRMFHTSKGGLYGFVSSHAANGFALSMFLTLMYGWRKGGWLFLWAIIMGYSRSYLGKHYPGDVICGAILGIGVGALVYWVISRIKRWTMSKSGA